MKRVFLAILFAFSLMTLNVTAHEGLCKNVLRLPLVPVSENVRQDIENEYDNNLK